MQLKVSSLLPKIIVLLTSLIATLVLSRFAIQNVRYWQSDSRTESSPSCLFSETNAEEVHRIDGIVGDIKLVNNGQLKSRAL